jgi:hypothetical protein
MKRDRAAAKAAQEDHDHQVLYQRLAREQELFEQLATAKRGIETAARQAERSRFALMEDGARLLDRLRAAQNPSRRTLGEEGQDNLRKQAAELNEAVARLRQTAAEDARRVEDLNAEITRLETVDIPACKGETTVGDVIAHRASVAAAEKRLHEIAALIETQEAFIAALKFENVDEYDVMLEGLRAELVMGALPDQEFARREAEIIAKRDAAKQANDRLQQDASIARSTIAGLQMRQREAAEELDALHALTERVLAHFLRSEMERLGEEYVPVALQVRDLFIRAVGLNGLARTYPGAGAILHDNWMASVSLPSLRVNACQGKVTPAGGGILFSAEFGRYNSLWESALESEKARFLALGVPM